MADTTPVVTAQDVRIRFPGETRDAVRDVSLALREGERVGILGPSGCGKSTLALALAGAIPALVPADLRGTIAWSQHVPSGQLAAGSGLVAFVQQDVESQLVALSVEGEIAFALENRDCEPAAIDAAIAQALAVGPARGLGAQDETLTLSTGWRQRLALAAALAERASLTILDEPTAHLDEGAAQEAIAFVTAGAPGALLLIEHRADLIAPLADRVLVLDRDGAPIALAAPGSALEAVARRPDLGLRFPPIARAVLCLRRHGIAVDAGLMPGLAALQGLSRDRSLDVRHALASELVPQRKPASPGPTLLDLQGVMLRRGDRTALADVSLHVGAGEVVGIAGGNGAGKTSLCLVAAGALRPTSGRRTLQPGLPARMVPQNPSLVFASASLALEARRRGLDWPVASRCFEAFGLRADPRRHPLHHSRGELRRIALALALAGDRPMLAVLDEPTAGLDAHGLAALGVRLEACRTAGSGALVVSHDIDWLAATCDRIVVLAAGHAVAAGPAAAIARVAVGGQLPLAPPPGLALAVALGMGAGT